MRDPRRIDNLLNIIRVYWKKNPNMRLSQILSIAAYKAQWINKDLFYLEDNKLFEGLTKLMVEGNESSNN